MRLAYRVCKKHLFNGINELYKQDVSFYIRKTTEHNPCYTCKINSYYLIREIASSLYSTYKQDLRLAEKRTDLIGIFNIKEVNDNG